MPRSTVLDPDQVLDAARESMLGDTYIGFCLACGAEVYGVEPDAREYTCEECDAHKVYGAPELLIMGYAE